MRTIFFILLLLPFVLKAQEAYTIYENIRQQDSTTFLATCYEYYANGKIFRKYACRCFVYPKDTSNNRHFGLYQHWDEKGRLACKIWEPEPWKLGFIKDSVSYRYRENGQVYQAWITRAREIVEEGNHKNVVSREDKTHYYANGQIRISEIWSADLSFRQDICYYPNGKIARKGRISSTYNHNCSRYMMQQGDVWECYNRKGRKLADVKPDYVLCKDINVRPDNLSTDGQTIIPPNKKD